MEVRHTSLEGVLVFLPDVFEDERGSFFESWNAATFNAETGLELDFVQDNHSRSVAGALRGIHYQLPRPQGKLVRCVGGAVWDVAIDLRKSSPTFGRSVGVELTADNHLQLWVPPGFGHGFVALSPVADVLYKTTDHYVPEADRAIRWDDPDLAVDWRLDGSPLLSAKDAEAPLLADAVVFD